MHLGAFIEVEKIVADESAVPEAIKAIDAFAETYLGLSADSIENERYDVLIERVRSGDL